MAGLPAYSAIAIALNEQSVESELAIASTTILSVPILAKRQCFEYFSSLLEA
jgi:hypothetical protein